MEDWSKGLQRRGVFFDGWVEDIDGVLDTHKKATVTTYGTRHSSKVSGACSNKENEAPKNESEKEVSNAKVNDNYPIR